MFKKLLVSVSLLASSTAMAQTDDGATTKSPPETSDSGITEIIVTASRRAENVQRTALSIQALSPESLTKAGVTRPEDLSSIAAGVQIGTGGNNPQTYIRGVGNYAANVYAEGAVAYNIDGVYISRPWATRGLFFDLARVEVLKGPQGTLYGRNASGGAINIISAKPVLDRVEGFVEGEFGNYDLFRATGAINLPLGPNLALRAAGQVTTRDGYLSDGSDDDKSRSARLSLLWQATPNISLIVHGGYQHVGGRGPGSVVYPYRFSDAWTSATNPAVTSVIRAEPGIGAFIVAPAADNYTRINVYSVDAELNWNLGPATLTIVPAYRDSQLDERTYVPGFRVNDTSHDKQTSLEIRLGNATPKLKWVVGAYYFDEDQGKLGDKDLLLVEQGVNTQRTPIFTSNVRSYAGFGQVTYSLAPVFRVTGGLRYTYERKTQSGLTQGFGFPDLVTHACTGTSVFDPATPSPPLFCRTDIPLQGRPVDKSWTYKVGLEYDLGPASMAYINYSTGFKSGGLSAAPPPNTFKPESLRAIEFGVKNRFLDNRLQVNVEGFYWKYKDHQESHVGPTSLPGFFTFITENAGSAVSYGADVDVLYRATKRDQITVKVQWNKTKYDTFDYSNFTAAFGPPTTLCAVGPLVNGSQMVDCSGFQLVRSPTWSGTAAYTHAFDLKGGATIDWSASTQFSSSHYLSIDFLESGLQKSYAMLNSDLTYTSPDKRWSITAYVRNLTGQAISTQASRFPFVSAANPLLGQDSLFFNTIRPPRTYGIRARFDF